MNDAAKVHDVLQRVKAGELKRPTTCVHQDLIVEDVEPAAQGCVDCLAAGEKWIHLRICVTCGYIGCCNSSPNKHAHKHAIETGHHVVMSMENGEEWLWCYEDEDYLVARRR